MRYRNKLTGIEIDFKSPVSGENWEPAEATAGSKAEEPEKPAKEAKNGRTGKKQLRDSK